MLLAVTLLVACSGVKVSSEPKEGYLHIYAAELDVNDDCSGEGYLLTKIIDVGGEVTPIVDNKLYVEPGFYWLHYAPQRLEMVDGACQIITRHATQEKLSRFIEINVGSYPEYEFVKDEGDGDLELEGHLDE